MTENMATGSTVSAFTAFTLAFTMGTTEAAGTAGLDSQQQYPSLDKSYEVKQQPGSYSNIRGRMTLNSNMENFTQQMSTMYNQLALRQEPLGSEFEAAIFSDIENLYEA